MPESTGLTALQWNVLLLHMGHDSLSQTLTRETHGCLFSVANGSGVLTISEEKECSVTAGENEWSSVVRNDIPGS